MNIFSQNITTSPTAMQYTDALATKVNEGSGVAQWVKLIRNILMLSREAMQELGRTFYLPEVSRAISKFDTTFKTLIFNKIVQSSVKFKETLSSSAEKTKKIYATLDFVGDALTVSGLFGASIAKMSNVTGLINTFIDTEKHLGEVSKNDSAAEDNFNSKCNLHKYLITPLTLGMIKNPILTEENPAEIRKITMLKVVKDIISIATGILAVTTIATGAVLVSELALLIVSTLSIILSLTTKVLEENTSHKVALLNLSK